MLGHPTRSEPSGETPWEEGPAAKITCGNPFRTGWCISGSCGSLPAFPNFDMTRRNPYPQALNAAERTYEINEVAKLTGLAAARLRAWERRYAAVSYTHLRAHET